jgi:positive regulator of sigma E activity
MTSSDKYESIEHEGVVKRTDSSSSTVIITTTSACSGCHAEGMCTLSGKEEKIIEVTGSYNLSPGDIVTVRMKKSMGYNALFLGYILPLIVVILTLILLISISVPEGWAGLGTILVLLPYYIILWLFRNRINSKFSFTIKT